MPARRRSAATTRSSSSAARTAARPASVLRVDPKKQRVYVEGLNIIKRHQRPQQTRRGASRRSGGVIESEGPIHVSNVMLVDPKDSKPTRVGIAREDGKRVRVAQAERAADSTDDGRLHA